VQAVSRLPLELKWPNDLVIGRPWRKLGGVLSEAATSGARIQAVVIGIGINLRQASYPRELAGHATSIETELGRPIERAPLVVELLGRLRAIMERLHRGDRESVCRDWRAFGCRGLAGATVRWHDQRGERRGRARDLAEDGALLVETDEGLERVIGGEVAWESWARGDAERR
jgi:BirA family biotin operon repressor/biotin-[acetyl-CoA-carboxylase] ligase